jgi:hypothetical protein
MAPLSPAFRGDNDWQSSSSSSGKLGVTGISSIRFKEAVKPMDKASEAILQLKPVTFRYKQEIDPNVSRRSARWLSKWKK